MTINQHTKENKIYNEKVSNIVQKIWILLKFFLGFS